MADFEKAKLELQATHMFLQFEKRRDEREERHDEREKRREEREEKYVKRSLCFYDAMIISKRIRSNTSILRNPLDELQWMAKQQYIKIENIMITSENHEECFPIFDMFQPYDTGTSFKNAPRILSLISIYPSVAALIPEWYDSTMIVPPSNITT